ncbi:hypothetical protein AUEXF2481DRAFT_477520 [Aureobasidium subglaciale EXF-2481]|uniref:Uncharacterized protein n=1 Tax=Aureobasidium subglaciale (strain EXF-2481) TaxID=1043005 RepID=A0A074YKE2_AURSE|nr:uncharacterized protein AUEXF2481DRAFT_477520 [Aureobasidium subglaciale EXF-2481]KEQ98293.1 hypothetical protein AUEXF2481DRAFT_477520 [Aureobasidium subglaciale EXF-2481]
MSIVSTPLLTLGMTRLPWSATRAGNCARAVTLTDASLSCGKPSDLGSLCIGNVSCRAYSALPKDTDTKLENTVFMLNFPGANWPTQDWSTLLLRLKCKIYSMSLTTPSTTKRAASLSLPKVLPKILKIIGSSEVETQAFTTISSSFSRSAVKAPLPACSSKTLPLQSCPMALQLRQMVMMAKAPYPTWRDLRFALQVKVTSAPCPPPAAARCP